MSVNIHHDTEGQFLEIAVTGKLVREDYRAFVPEVERLIKEHGQVRMLVRLDDFHGWKAGALWEDIKFDLRHFNDIERLAIVGETKWQKGMAAFCRPFTTAKIRYFEQEQAEQARNWLAEPSHARASS